MIRFLFVAFALFWSAPAGAQVAYGTPSLDISTGGYVAGDGTLAGDITLGIHQLLCTNGSTCICIDDDCDSILYASTDDVVRIYATGTNGLTVTSSGITSSGSITLATSGILRFGTNSSRLYVPGGGTEDGSIVLTNNNQNNFDQLMFGGETSSFPSLKRNGTVLYFRKADDSAYSNAAANMFAAYAQKGAYGATTTTVESVTFADDASKTTTGGIRPQGAVILGVMGRVTTALEGCSSVDVGDGSTQALYADDLALGVGTTFDSTDATANWLEARTSDGEITVTANTSNCTAGVVRLTVFHTTTSPDTSN